jgi:hypothetical protein
MTTTEAEARPAADIEAARQPYRELVALAVLVVVADVLLYGRPPGVSVTLFLSAVCAAAALANAASLEPRRVLAALVVLAIGLAPGVESFNLVSVLFGVAGAALFVRVATGRVAGGPGREALATLWVALAGPIQAVLDAAWLQAALRRSPVSKQRWERLLAWSVPATLGLVFLFLFRAANPIIDDALGRIDVARFFQGLSVARAGLWIAVAAACWSFVFVGRFEPQTKEPAASAPKPSAPASSGPIFGEAAVLRSLVVFNVLFAAQTVMDIAYLWAEADLPANMTYAAYAYRGAYALLAAALLAAAFMLTAMRNGQTIDRSPIIRVLAYLWMAQNVLLVVSSMRRVELYVEAYSLTYLRVAALIWMLLVAVGLALIVCKIAFRRSAAWLVLCNAGALALTLYVCSFVSFADVIARYNVAHSREMGGPGPALDVEYLCSLGPEALPALDRAAAARVESAMAVAAGCAWALAVEIADRPDDWRSWTLRERRLSRYLKSHASP